MIHRLGLSTVTHSLVHGLHTVLCVSSFNRLSAVCHEGQALLQQKPPHLISFSCKPSPTLLELPLQAVSLAVWLSVPDCTLDVHTSNHNKHQKREGSGHLRLFCSQSLAKVNDWEEGSLVPGSDQKKKRAERLRLATPFSDPKAPTKRHLELIHKFSKAVVFKISSFYSGHNELLENEIKKNIPFTASITTTI